MSELALGSVNQDSPRSAAEGQEIPFKATKRGELCVVDMIMEMILEGRAFQVRLGTVTTPVTGDIAITDTAAEMCVDAALGLVVVPMYFNVLVESHAGGTLPECAVKSVGALSTAGDVFIPLPLYMNGRAAAATARADEAGSCTVAAEAVDTTRRHFTNMLAAVGNYILADHSFPRPPVLQGLACLYAQIVAETAGPVYHASLDFFELPTVNVS